MKSSTVALAEWQGLDTDGYIDIPWPRVHRQAGRDTVAWLEHQDWTRVQMMVNNTDGHCQLVAEFFCDQTRCEFALRFGR
jgi:hypothetical protein